MGTNSKFQMGTGSNESYLIPTKLVDGNITDIVAGANHSFYLDSNGSLWTMGRNESGQLGDGTTTAVQTPVQVSPPDIIATAAGYTHSLFLDSAGRLRSMGKNIYGSIGDAEPVYRSSPYIFGSLEYPW